ncbi:MAG TPA: hypothetical protein VF945_08315, partial [Polyangia bacterium]
EVACKVEYAWKGKSKGFVELAHVTPPPVASNVPPPASTVEAWARSERTAGWDKLPGNAEDVIKECSKIAAGE